MGERGSYPPYLRLACLKFELTNQDLAGRESLVNRNSVETRQLFLLEIALNVHEKGFTIPKPYQIVENEKISQMS